MMFFENFRENLEKGGELAPRDPGPGKEAHFTVWTLTFREPPPPPSNINSLITLPAPSEGAGRLC